MAIYSLWDSAYTPANVADSESAPITLGTEFSVSEDAQCIGVRYYRFSGNTGEKVGGLYDNLGALLASVIFTGETASGWQEALFATPVALTAGTRYRASVYHPDGYYAYEGVYFSSSVTVGPITAPIDAGKFSYATGISLPANDFNSSSYFIDPIIQTAETGGVGSSAFALTSHAPTVQFGGAIQSSPGSSAFVLTAHAPTVQFSGIIQAAPGNQSLALTAHAPTASFQGIIQAAPVPANLALIAHAPTVQFGGIIQAAPGSSAFALTTHAPTVQFSGVIQSSPETSSLSLAFRAPSVQIGVTSGDYLVIENGDYLVTENGDRLLVTAQQAVESYRFITEDGDYLVTEDGDYLVEQIPETGIQSSGFALTFYSPSAAFIPAPGSIETIGLALQVYAPRALIRSPYQASTAAFQVFAHAPFVRFPGTEIDLSPNRVMEIRLPPKIMHLRKYHYGSK